ncbi:MAG: BCD family MFS transporter [Myxococcota bacterium]
MQSYLTWIQIVRLGLVQTALGAIVVLTTSTMNRVMVVELAFPAMVPGILVGLHSAVQILRPRWGYDSDMGGRRSPWIVGGIGVLACGGVLASVSVAWMATEPVFGLTLAVFAFLLVGAGVGVGGTSLLAMLAARTAPPRRAAAASIVWLMMIAGFVVTTILAGINLDPFSLPRLVAVTTVVALSAFGLTVFALWGIESRFMGREEAVDREPRIPFREAFLQVWADSKARAFTVFVFVSMLAYNTQDLILEPFAGAVFGFTPGESTKLTSVQHSGAFIGMVMAGFLASGRRGPRFGSTKTWTTGGCVASGLVLMTLAFGGLAGPTWPLRPTVFALGLANGAFAVAAIGWMMRLAGEGRASREGTRMGLWGGAQAVAFALGGFLGTLGVDLVRFLHGSEVVSYASVFVFEGSLFLLSAGLAARMEKAKEPVPEPVPAVPVLNPRELRVRTGEMVS